MRGDAGEGMVECVWNPPPCGRRTEGQSFDCAPPDSVGAWLATAAFLEAGSVDAFVRLSTELAAHGAPRALVLSARRAAADEVRHARDVSALSRRYAREPRRPARVRVRRRSLARIALENAIEGCICETYGALVATYQARHASDPAIRHAFRAIAAEETAHAALAREIAEWAAPKLSRATRARIARASQREIEKIRRELATDPEPELVETLGLPNAAAAQQMFDRMIAALG